MLAHVVQMLRLRFHLVPGGFSAGHVVKDRRSGIVSHGSMHIPRLTIQASVVREHDFGRQGIDIVAGVRVRVRMVMMRGASGRRVGDGVGRPVQRLRKWLWKCMRRSGMQVRVGIVEQTRNGSRVEGRLLGEKRGIRSGDEVLVGCG